MDGSDPGQKKTIGWIDLLLSNSRGAWTFATTAKGDNSNDCGQIYLMFSFRNIRNSHVDFGC